MTQKGKLVSSSALVGFIGGLGALVFLIHKHDSEFWELYFLMPFEASVLFPIAGSCVAALVGSRFEPNNFCWLQGLELAWLSLILFGVARGVAIGVHSLFLGLPLSMAVATMVVIPLTDIFFGTVLIGWIIFPLGALFGFYWHRRFNKSLNTDASKAGAG